jgi:hypothetical protein
VLGRAVDIQSVILDMARLPASGATIVFPLRDDGELHHILADLDVGHAFDARDVHDLYWNLGKIIGQWMSEQQRLEVSPVAKALLSTAGNLSAISVLLGGLEAGLHSDLEIAVSSRIAQYLAFGSRCWFSREGAGTHFFISAGGCPDCPRLYGGGR